MAPGKKAKPTASVDKKRKLDEPLTTAVPKKSRQAPITTPDPATVPASQSQTVVPAVGPVQRNHSDQACSESTAVIIESDPEDAGKGNNKSDSGTLDIQEIGNDEPVNSNDELGEDGAVEPVKLMASNGTQSIFAKIGQPLSMHFTMPFPTSATKMGGASIHSGVLHVGAPRSSVGS